MRNLAFFSLLFLGTPLIVLIPQPSEAQSAVPMLVNYQGELRSPATGEPVPDGSYNMVFRILDAESVGVLVWQGTHSDINGNPVQVANGIFSVILGSGAGNALDASVFNGADRWLEIRVGMETLSPRQRISSVAYSLVSENSRLLGGNEPSDFVIQAQGLRLETNATSPNVIGGYGENGVTAGAVGATIAGGGSAGFTNRVTDDYGTIGGGGYNRAGDNAGTTTNAYYATVAGGWGNTASGQLATVGGGNNNTASNSYSTVAGGSNNTAGGPDATVAGGACNQANARYATIAGGGPSDPSNWPTTRNLVTDDYGTIGGGGDNQAGDNAGTTGDRTFATVGGGNNNTASDSYATVAGGMNNAASGYQSTVSGGYSNEASGDGSAVCGGRDNTATGERATVAAGYKNTAAGDYSFAAGTRAKANHPGAFVWGDSQNVDIASSADDQVTFRCVGGVRFLSGVAGANQTVSWVPGNALWTFSSDRSLKENFLEIDPKEVLDRVCRLPVTEWNFKGYPQRHVGPVAQDFQALFPLGASDIMIDSGDLHGISLAAIQGVHKVVQEKDARIAALEKQNAELEARLTAVEAVLKSLVDEAGEK